MRAEASSYSLVTLAITWTPAIAVAVFALTLVATVASTISIPLFGSSHTRCIAIILCASAIARSIRVVVGARVGVALAIPLCADGVAGRAIYRCTLLGALTSGPLEVLGVRTRGIDRVAARILDGWGGVGRTRSIAVVAAAWRRTTSLQRAGICDRGESAQRTR